jgi:hypothetical protein
MTDNLYASLESNVGLLLFGGQISKPYLHPEKSQNVSVSLRSIR